MAAEVLEFTDVFQEYQGAHYSGRMKLTPAALIFRQQKSGKTETLQKENLDAITFGRRARDHGLRVKLQNGQVHRFDGLKSADFDKLLAFCEDKYQQTINRTQPYIKGTNCGELTVDGVCLSFTSDEQPVFEIPLNTVSNATSGKNELTLEFQPNDDAAVSLTELRFYVPSEEELAILVEKSRSEAGVDEVTGEEFCAFSEVDMVQPRGKYDLKLYQTFFLIHGKTFDYRVPYTSIVRLFLLPHREQHLIYFAVQIDPPLKHGQTRYHFLLFHYDREVTTKLELNISEEDNKEKFGGALESEYHGLEYEVVSRLFKAVSSRKILLPAKSGFKSRCSYKANLGELHSLERGFLFLPKPTIFVRLDETESVTFQRSQTLMKSFDIDITLTTGVSYTFTNLDKADYPLVFDYLKEHKVHVKNTGDAHAAAAVQYSSDSEEEHDPYVARAKAEVADEDEDESEDEDYNPDKDTEARPDTSATSSDGSEAEGGAPKKLKRKTPSPGGSDEEEEEAEEASASTPPSDSGEDEEKPKKVAKKPKSPKKAEKPKKGDTGGAPKRPLGAFFIFCGDKRSGIRAANPTFGVADVARKLGALWKDCDDKTDYEERAAEDKLRYEREMKEFKDGGGEVPARKTKTKKASKKSEVSSTKKASTKKSSTSKKVTASPKKSTGSFISKDTLSSDTDSDTDVHAIDLHHDTDSD